MFFSRNGGGASSQAGQAATAGGVTPATVNGGSVADTAADGAGNGGNGTNTTNSEATRAQGDETVDPDAEATEHDVSTAADVSIVENQPQVAQEKKSWPKFLVKGKVGPDLGKEFLRVRLLKLTRR